MASNIAINGFVINESKSNVKLCVLKEEIYIYPYCWLLLFFRIYFYLDLRIMKDFYFYTFV